LQLLPSTLQELGQLCLLPCQALLVHHQLWAQVVHKVQVVLQGLQVLLGHRVLLVQLGLLAHKVRLEQVAQQEPLELKHPTSHIHHTRPNKHTTMLTVGTTMLMVDTTHTTMGHTTMLTTRTM
jgi:hypothetical protein